MIFIDLINAIRGILKRRKVESMLCAEYSYKMDIAVKKEEAFKEGIAAGISQGAQQKAIEDARKLLADKNYTAEEISELLQIPIEAFVETKK